MILSNTNVLWCQLPWSQPFVPMTVGGGGIGSVGMMKIKMLKEAKDLEMVQSDWWLMEVWKHGVSSF